jgi:hypothetical protein
MFLLALKSTEMWDFSEGEIGNKFSIQRRRIWTESSPFPSALPKRNLRGSYSN